MIQGLERSFVTLFGLLNRFRFGDALLRVGQVAFPGRYEFRCGVKLFSLYKFAEKFPDRSQVVRIPKSVA